MKIAQQLVKTGASVFLWLQQNKEVTNELMFTGLLIPALSSSTLIHSSLQGKGQDWYNDTVLKEYEAAGGRF